MSGNVCVCFGVVSGCAAALLSAAGLGRVIVRCLNSTLLNNQPTKNASGAVIRTVVRIVLIPLDSLKTCESPSSIGATPGGNRESGHGLGVVGVGCGNTGEDTRNIDVAVRREHFLAQLFGLSPDVSVYTQLNDSS